MLSEIIALGKRIYDTNNPREVHRLLVFIGRSLLHTSSLRELMDFFTHDALRQRIFAKNPFPLEQVTRAFFYANSTFQERMMLIKTHYMLLQEKLQPKWAEKLACFNGNYEIWKSADEDIQWNALLTFEPGQRKEGLLSLDMRLDGQHLYQIMFWLNKDKQGEDALWIGAMQGPNRADAKDVVKETTKRAHRYRTKNLILYMTMAVARSFGCRHIYAVSNEGYYANNHVRRDRKLKTDFGAFWQEAGGHVAEDKRFYEIPLIEPRKTMEEVPTRKRAVYRKRFAFQDDVDAQIAANLEKIAK